MTREQRLMIKNLPPVYTCKFYNGVPRLKKGNDVVAIGYHNVTLALRSLVGDRFKNKYNRYD